MKLHLSKSKKTTAPHLVSYKRAHDEISPHRMWDRLLGGFAFLLVGVILFAVFLFYRIENEILFNPEIITNQVAVPIQKTKLEAVLKRFDERAIIRTEIENTPPSVVDPSVAH